MRISWDETSINEAIEELQESETLEEAANRLSKRWGAAVTKSALDRSFRRKMGEAPGQFLGRYRHSSTRQAEKRQTHQNPASDIDHSYRLTDYRDPELDEAIQDLARAVKRGAHNLELLCDALDLPPKIVRAQLAVAQEMGFALNVDGDIVNFSIPEQEPVVLESTGTGTKTDPHIFAAISDTHAGSEKFAKKDLIRFIRGVYDDGCRHVVHAGDLMDGTYHRGQAFEQHVAGFEKQANDLLEALPELDGMHYYCIVGNHDINGFFKSTGMDPGRGFQRLAREHGREDIHYIGGKDGDTVRGRLMLGGENPDTAIKIELAHPTGMTPQGKSWPAQKWVGRGYEGGDKPHFLILGHYHTFNVVDERNVVAINPGCFEWQTAYMQAKGLAPAVGGVLVKAWRNDYGIRYIIDNRKVWPRGVNWVQAD